MKKLNIGNLSAALAEFQFAVPELDLNKTVKVTTKSGSTYNFKYADLSEVKSKIKESLHKNGLSYSQLITPMGLETILMHTSGEYLRSVCPLPGTAQNAQEFGSQITYVKRYALVAILGLVSDEDDDANVSVGNTAVFQPSIAKSVDHVDNEFNKSVCPKCGGKIAISAKGNPFCTGKCYTDWKATQK